MYQQIQFAISLRFRFFGCSLTSAPSFPSFWQVRWAAAWFDISCLEKRGRGWKLMISHYPVERDQSRPSDISISSPAHPPNPTHLLPHSHCTAMHFTQHFLGVWQAAFGEIHEQWSGSATLVGRRAAISQCQIDHFDQCLISPTYLPCIIISLCVTTKNPLPMWKIQIHVCNFLYLSTFPLWQ